MRLSILIPTLPERAHRLGHLLAQINDQVCREKGTGAVEVLTDQRDRGVPTGTKRNELMMRAQGEYIVFIDDDDDIASFYIREILRATKDKPDVITFNGHMTTNGSARKEFQIRLGEKYEERGGVYFRYPNHLCPMRKDLVQNFRFPDVTYGEDYEWATAIMLSGVLRTECVIEKDMYHYDFKNK